MVLSPSEAWNTAYEATPASSSAISAGDDDLRDLKRNIRERLEIDHDFDATGGNDTGEHMKVTLRVRTAPTQEADKGMLYAKDVSSKAELHYIDEDGNEVQITTSGSVSGATASPTHPMNEQGSAPSTSAGQGTLYTKDTGGQPELFYREESDGDEVQITAAGVLSGGPTASFAATDQVLSPMTAAPTGWTLVTTWNDRVLRIRNVGGQATGGSASVASGTVTSGAGSSHSHTGPATHASHVHTGSLVHLATDVEASTGSGVHGWSLAQTFVHSSTGTNVGSLTHGSTGSESAHTHIVTYNLSYLDIIAIQKA